MRKITRTVTKTVEETVQVCDTCGQEKPLVIAGSWSVGCRYDGCYADNGRFEFCSVRCFLDEAQKALDDIGKGDDFFESLNISLNNDGDEFERFVAYLKDYRRPEGS